jgi:7-cyano-7-deazaguanine synthase
MMDRGMKGPAFAGERCRGRRRGRDHVEVRRGSKPVGGFVAIVKIARQNGLPNPSEHLGVTEYARKAVVLLSGGLDSATVLAIARGEGFGLYALSVDYGQRHRFELESARRVAASLGVVEHRVLAIDLAALGGSALTADIAVPQDRSADELSAGIPVTYVPARNTVMLALALGYAETIGAADIFIGVNAVDYSGYPDCRPEFIAAFERVANLATKAGVEGTLRFRIHAPLVELTKAEIIRRGVELGVDYGLTHTCYAPDAAGRACGRCDACQLRLKGFAEAGRSDPAAYQVKL